ncbi:MAG: aldehyde dehydrogenase family protein [Acidimicrobiia bacterium]
MTVQRLVSPVDGIVLAERVLADGARVEVVLTAAHSARRGWAAVSVERRAAMVEAMVRHLESEVDEIAVELTRQMGRPVRYTPNEISRGFQERARHMASIAPARLAPIEVPPTDGFTKFIRREPVGTVLVIAPWNYPYLTAVNSIVPALLAGNTVVLKHASQTMLVAERLQRAFDAVGLPPGVFQHLHAGHDAIAAMIADPRIDGVVFTGSVPGGAAIERAAAGRFIGVGTELGGKDPSYVRADADLPYAIGENVDGAFFNSGQSCCAIERIYVHRSVYRDFVDGFVDATRAYILGNPLDHATTIGPMVSATAAASVRSQIAEALAAGATALVGESDFAASRLGTPYLGPTVLVDVMHEMRVMSEESFGPVIGIMPVDGDDEAISRMNDSRYGLTASIWTRDADAAVRIGERVETGTVYMNRCDYVDPVLVWTGVKETGHGIALSSLGFDPYLRPKSYHLKHA